MSKTVEQHLIGVTITFGIHGVPIYRFSSLFGAESTPEQFSIGTGDQVAWRVVVMDTDQTISSPAFTLGFSNPAIFGMNSLAVPGGGVSPFLQALSLSGSTKYTLTVAGINPADDPVIQIDNTGLSVPARVKGAAVKPVSYQVYWDDTNGGVPTWQVGGAMPQAFPMAQPLNSGDMVTFSAAPGANSFTIVFDVPPPEPLFNGEGDFFTIPSTVAGPSTAPQTVLNFLAGKTFGFTFQDAVGNVSASGTFFKVSG